MSPEQLQSIGDVSPASDIWSTGVVLYEMLTGTRPFQGKDLNQLSDAIRNSSPDAPSSIVKNIPRKIDRICLKCLEKSPANRYQSAQQLADELKDCLTVPVFRRKRWIVTTAVLAIGIFSFVWLNRILDDSPVVCDRLKSECKLVVNFESTANVDLAKMRVDPEKTLRDLGDWLVNETRIESDFILPLVSQATWEDAGNQWFCWRVPVQLQDIDQIERRVKEKNSGPEADAGGIITPSSISHSPSERKWIEDYSSLWVAVNESGDIQIGTDCEDNRAHLLFLALSGGISNYKSVFQTVGGKPQMLDESQYIVPRGQLVDNDQRQTILSSWAIHVYAGLRAMGWLSSDGPSNSSEIYDCRFDLVNYFDQPITVFQSRLLHANMRDVIEGTAPIYQAANMRWSPLIQGFRARDFNRNRKPPIRKMDS